MRAEAFTPTLEQFYGLYGPYQSRVIWNIGLDLKEATKMSTETAKPQGRSLADEIYREYKFASGQVYRIDSPKLLFVGKMSHRVLDDADMVHIVVFPGPNADTVLTYKPRDPGNPVAF